MLKKIDRHSICWTCGQRTNGLIVEAVEKVILSCVWVGNGLTRTDHRNGLTPAPMTADFKHQRRRRKGSRKERP